MKILLAQQVQDLGSPLSGVGPLGLEGGEDWGDMFNKFLSTAIGVMTIIAAIWFTFLFISGAIGYMSSGGDKAKTESASKRITNGIIGLVIVIAAIFIVNLIGYIFGIDDILNPANFVKTIW